MRNISNIISRLKVNIEKGELHMEYFDIFNDLFMNLSATHMCS